MIHRVTRSFCCAIILIVCAPAVGQKSDPFATAASLSNIRASGSTPYQLRITFHTVHLTAKPMDGSYEELWADANNWSRATRLPEFVQLEWEDKNGHWLDRNLDFRPPPVTLIEDAVNNAALPRIQSNEKLIKFREKKKHGQRLQCAELDGEAKWRRTVCFDSAGHVAEVEGGWVSPRFEYDDYMKFGDKTFPSTIRVFKGQDQVLEARVEELSPLPSSASIVPAHTVNAEKIPGCINPEPPMVKQKKPPTYPQSAKNVHQQGSSTVVALIGEDGNVRRTKTIRSAGTAIDEATDSAVKQWLFQPAMCGSTPVPAEIEITVNFTLSP